jgi:DNA primase
MPVVWENIEHGIQLADYRIDNVPSLLRSSGDLWKPLLGKKRFDLYTLAKAHEA